MTVNGHQGQFALARNLFGRETFMDELRGVLHRSARLHLGFLLFDLVFRNALREFQRNGGFLLNGALAFGRQFDDRVFAADDFEVSE